MISPEFKTIQLHEMDRVKMMNRTDQKFWFHIDQLQSILDEVRDHYFMLDIDEKSMLPYSTVYFDTYENEMYLSHHNGHLNRYKIRRRTYVQSGKSFMEVKHKTNKGRTIKTRINTNENIPLFSPSEEDFIATETPYSADNLTPILINQFTRLMLVNKNFKERCTIDFNLKFKTKDDEVEVKNIAIIELKADGNSELSPLGLALRNHRIKSSGFSKYCTGRMLTDPTLKQNRFKVKLRSLKKTLMA